MGFCKGFGIGVGRSAGDVIDSDIGDEFVELGSGYGEGVEI